MVIAVVVAMGKWQRPGRSPQIADARGRTMLAVLPFENLTGEEGQEYFSDGLTEEMIAQLGRLDPQKFGVIARTSMMLYKHTAKRRIRLGGSWACNMFWKEVYGEILAKCASARN
jgi:TolB-like protein